MKRALLASAVSLAAIFAGTVSPAFAQDAALRHVRVCDLSACYYAWNVVDSDGDGYSDADEIVAGSDPYDAQSRPTLSLIVDLIGAQLLPTFEFGVGKIIVNPAELQAELEARGGGQDSPLAAFPLGQRKDALTRLGLDTDLLAAHGYQTEFDGLTLVRGNDDKGAPVRRVGGVDIRLISAGDDAGTTKIPDDLKVEYKEDFKDGSTFIKYTDGSSLLISPSGQADYRGPDGKPVKSFYNPDADTGSGEPTEEDIKAWERVRNATIRTMAGWQPISGDPADIRDPNETIMLVDPDYPEQNGQVFDPPQIDKAQGETRPDLPNPVLDGGGCWPKCGT
ncbi:hypothetical protein GCM10023307_23140 [Lysobacter hankyongensis]|uniref:Uncharacterized protein n=2 Tax=Lysobacter hankyongensis TaxID=1176535 RepID=A0ABP9BN30_9GAMM